MTKKKFYAVIKGRQPGVYQEWFGENGAEAQITGFPGAVYKGFPTLFEAKQWFERGCETYPEDTITQSKIIELPTETIAQTDQDNNSQLPQVTIYTDGACIKNPGPGGYGVVLLYGEHRKELSGGFRLTTNNRMEILAAIVGLKALKTRCNVIIHSDSRYLVDAIMLGWAERWRANNWKRTKTEMAINPDLWEQVLQLCAQHQVKLVWVQGHAGNPENERCDQLATRAAQQANLPPDERYETARKMPLTEERFSF